ncbi:transcriptional regulator [Lysobacter soli]|uniref:winged helix-turn-helix domain-containing protein n=1 Tax=Lysobacter soli TaxID=453783 RepID=UPI00209D9961|nr:transcriptional regulator [Lysobacter soli]UTA54936.1 transcriptional regulator [Lysobacter soli]
MRRTRYRFQEFEIDPPSRDLLRDGERVALPPKSFDCLAYLVMHRDRAVGRDELIAAVWGRVEVTDMVVAQTMLRARKALGDSGALQRAIRTVPRFGYQWIAPVLELGSASASPASAQVHATPAPASTRHRRRTWLGWSGALMLAGAAAFSGWLFARAAPQPPQEASVQRDATLLKSRAIAQGPAVARNAPRYDESADARVASQECMPASCSIATSHSEPIGCLPSPAKLAPAAVRTNRFE